MLCKECQLELKKAIDKATLHKVNAYNNADYEGFIDKELLLKALDLE